MKKLLIIALVLSSVTSYAQISIGLRSGLQFSKIAFSGDDVIQEEIDLIKNISGTNFAIPIEFKVSDKFSVQPELSLSQRGYRVKIDFLGLPLSVRTRFNYFEMPILGKLSLGSGNTKFNLLAGPSIGYALSGNTWDGEKTVDFDFKGQGFKRFDFGLQFGGGLSFKVGPGNLFVDTRYLLGLANLNDSKDLSVKGTTRGLGFNLGYLYQLGGKN
jgi:hypothetical protein